MNIPISQHYPNVKGWYGFEHMYDALVRGIDEGSHFVEVGAYLGRSSIHLAYLSEKYKKNLRIDVIDIWATFEDAPPEIHKAFLDNPDSNVLYKEFLTNVFKCKADSILHSMKLPSIEAAELYEDESIDIVFIDANHTYPEVMKDLEAWYPKVKSVIAGDDYNWTGVEEAVNEYFGRDKRIFTGSKWLHYKDKSFKSKIGI